MINNADKHHSKSLSSFLSGGVAGVISKTVIAPIERIKYLFIVNSPISRKTSNRKFSYRLFMTDFLHVVNKHGVLNLWRGNLLNVAKIFPHAAIVNLIIYRISPFLIFCEPNFIQEEQNKP